MKNLYKAGCLAILLFTANDDHAQAITPLSQEYSSRPTLFAAFPEKTECNIVQLEQLFTLQPNQRVGFKLGQTIHLAADVSERVQKNDRQVSVNLRLEEYSNALFNISRITHEGSVSYTGRIVSPAHNDILLLVKEGEKYFLIRKERKFTMVE